jgi:serine/threonine protein kinase
VTCLGEDTLAEYLEGRLAPEARREVEAHIDGCDDCYDLFAELARQASPPAQPRSTGSQAALVEPVAGGAAPQPGPGDRVSRYEVRRLVGAGGMGVVYEAFDPVLGRRVALKLLHDGNGSSDEELQARLLGEAKALARLVHPNVVAVHDVGLAAGRVFLVMDFIEGQTLDGWLTASPAPRGWREILDAYEHAGRGLAAAHEAGLVHRDFKPTNVMVGDDARVYVTDFGLARLFALPGDDTVIGPEAPRRSEALGVHTRPGALVGSPHYMAPEQIAGERTDARADVFSFCVALYRGLFGRGPFAGRTLRALQANILEGRVRGLPDRSEVPRWLYSQVLLGLRARPDERPANLTALLRSLERERAVRGLRRTRRILDEADALSRLSGGRRLTQVAHTLLQELAGDPATAPASALRRASDPNPEDLEIRGADVAALLADVKDYATLVSHFLEREGFGNAGEDGTLRPHPDRWYPLLPMLRALHALVAAAGPRIAFELGLAMARRLRAPPGMDELRTVLSRPDLPYASLLRLRPGARPDRARPTPAAITAREGGPRALVLEMDGPWPPDFEHGVVTGLAQRFERDAVVTHEARPCRSLGDPACRFVVRWGEQDDCHASIRFEPASTVEDFLYDPYGRYFAGERVFYWCRDPQLLGSVWWGTPSERDLERVFGAFDVLTGADAVPHAALVDMRRVEAVDERVYRRFVDAIRSRRAALGKAIRSLAVVRPRSMAGALISGFFEVEQQPHPVRIFTNAIDALRWLGRPDACLAAELRALQAELTARPAAVPEAMRPAAA